MSGKYFYILLIFNILLLATCKPSSTENIRESAVSGDWYPSAPEELKKQADKDSGKTNNELAAEMFSPEEKPDAMKFINAIRLIKTQENLNEFYKMYKDAIMKLPAAQYEMVAAEIDSLEAKFNQ